MFEITPKEQLLKNVRKGLVQPLPNKYPLLNFEKEILKKPMLHSDESFIKVWIENGFYFSIYQGVHDLLHQIKNIVHIHNLGTVAVDEKFLIDNMLENDVPFLKMEEMDKTLFCSFSKLEINTNSLFFSTEVQPVRYFKKTKNLVLFGKANQIDSPENNKYYSDLTIKNDFKIHFPIQYLKNFESVFLFIEE